MNYIVTNTSLLPVGVADTLVQLEAEWRDGDLTRRGYLKRRSQILDNYPHLLQTNGTTVVPVKSVGGVAPGTRAVGDHLHGPLVSGYI